MAYAVEMKHITKSFGHVTANQDVSLNIEWGSIHGLIGENGAGKTTLMKCLYGMYIPEDGRIFIDGKEVRFRSPKDAISMGIGMVHQHFTLVDSLTVAQNLMLGKPVCRKNGLIDYKKADQIVENLGKEYGMAVDPRALIKDLPVAMRQRVEILKTLYWGAEILIMDEPTAVLTPQEITQLLKSFVLLKEKGKCIILITHKLKELLSVTDTITVLRNGLVTGQVKTAEVDEMKVAAMMVGKEILFDVKKAPAHAGEDALVAEHLTYYNRFGVKMVDDVSFHVKKGEIVGIAGVQGNGQSELIEVLTGLARNYKGKITIGGNDIAESDLPFKRRGMGLAHIPEDRQVMGAALGAGLLDNFLMGGIEDRTYTSKYFIQYKKAGEEAKKQFEKFDVKYAGLDAAAGSLSGGNLQKAIVARELYRDPQVLIAAQPSRGVDIGATMFIHEKLIQLRDKGKAIILISSELSEIMTLSDRILVMYKGGIVGEASPSDSSEEDIGLMMAGVRKEVANEL